jgi:hypothetical protein
LTRPRTASPRFDLDRIDEAFFDRLRDRVVAAGQRDIYVAVMFFDGWALHLSPAPDHVEEHPFHAANNINMDFGIIGGVNPSDPSAGGPMSYAAFEPARYAMGDTLRFAKRMNLIQTQPHGELSSTGYALADPGEEYLVPQPSATAEHDERLGFTAPSAETEPAVLYLRRAG